MAQHPHHETNHPGPTPREGEDEHGQERNEREREEHQRGGEHPQRAPGDVPGGSPPREEPKHSPSQTPAEREHHDNPKSAAPPEEDLAGPQREWIEKHVPPKERAEHEKQQKEQAKALQKRWREDEKDLEDPHHSHQGAAAPEPEHAKDHKPGEFEQPTRWDAPAQYGDRAG